MEIILHRAHKKPTHSIGKFYIDGKPWKDSCEDPDRGLNMWMPLAEIQAKKQYGNTAIPTGRYEITLTYSPTFGRELPLINGVPGWTGARIHAGNSSKDTKGCVLPGEAPDPENRDWVSNSRKAENELIEMIREEKQKGNRVFITII